MSIKWHLGNLIDHRILGQSILLRFLSFSSTTKNNDGSPPLLPRDHSSCRCNRWYLTVCRTTLQCAPLAILPAFPEPFLPLRKLRDVDEHLIDRHIFATYVLTQVRVWVWWKAFRSFCRANAVYWWCAAGAFGHFVPRTFSCPIVSLSFTISGKQLCWWLSVGSLQSAVLILSVPNMEPTPDRDSSSAK